MRKYFIFLIFYVMSSFALGDIPTVEGLFRNSSNSDWEGGLGVLKFRVREVTRNDENQKSNPILSKHYYKFILFQDPKNFLIQALLIEYSKGNMKPKFIQSKFYFQNLKKILSQDQNVERNFLFSILSMLMINNSEIVGEFLKKYGEGFVYNSEVLSREKVSLLRKYKKYLISIKADKGLKDTLTSPLRPEDLEERTKIKKILDGRMYALPQNATMVRDNGRPFWKTDLATVRAFFSNNKHQLKKIIVDVEEKFSELIFSEYIMFDGRHVFPKVFFMKSFDEKLYEFKVLSMQEIKLGKKNMVERSRDYDELIEKFSPQAFSQSLKGKTSNQSKLEVSPQKSNLLGRESQTFPFLF